MFTLAIVNVLVRTRMAGMDRTLIEASDGPVRDACAHLRAGDAAAADPGHRRGRLLAFTFSFDDFIIAFFTTGQDRHCPIFLFASIRRGVTPVVNAIATVLLTVTISSLAIAWLVGARRGRGAATVAAVDAPLAGEMGDRVPA